MIRALGERVDESGNIHGDGIDGIGRVCGRDGVHRPMVRRGAPGGIRIACDAPACALSPNVEEFIIAADGDAVGIEKMVAVYEEK